jgi:hypothetical protein
MKYLHSGCDWVKRNGGVGSAGLGCSYGRKVGSQPLEMVAPVFNALLDALTAISSHLGCAQQFGGSQEAALSPGDPALQCPDWVCNGVADMKVHLALLTTATTGINNHGVVIRYLGSMSDGGKIVGVEQLSQAVVFS